jgi:hypothetical protein
MHADRIHTCELNDSYLVQGLRWISGQRDWNIEHLILHYIIIKFQVLILRYNFEIIV